MGTPEFPDLGKHCSVDDCKLIDFLPFTCDRCIQVFCLDHRSYLKHQCPKGDRNDVTVVICPLCAKSVRLNPDEDPNITWESHAYTECDPSNYEKVTKKKKCPVPGCRDLLTFSNTVNCKDCNVDHCLKHRYVLDHKCPGPKKQETGFQFMSLLNKSKNGNSRKPSRAPPSTSSSPWATGFLNVASSFKAGMDKLSNEFNQAFQTGESSTGNERCPQCNLNFSSVTALVEHVEKVHEKAGNRGGTKVVLDVCPKCSRGFRDPVDLVNHVEKDHSGTSSKSKAKA